MVKSDYRSLIGKNKKQVLSELGDEFNIPFARMWTYKLKKTFFICRKLVLYFDEHHKVERYEVVSKVAFFSSYPLK